MQSILDFIKTEQFLLGLVIFNFVIFVLYIINLAKLSKLNKKYTTFMRKFSKNSSIEDDLTRYLENVEKVSEENRKTLNYCKNLDNRIDNCIQKIGIVRYSAFKDTGSDLSFAVALLDEKNDGILLNGIYSREMSNIYGKPIKKGKSEYTLSKEEEEALYKAINN